TRASSRLAAARVLRWLARRSFWRLPATRYDAGWVDDQGAGYAGAARPGPYRGYRNGSFAARARAARIRPPSAALRAAYIGSGRDSDIRAPLSARSAPRRALSGHPLRRQRSVFQGHRPGHAHAHGVVAHADA